LIATQAKHCGASCKEEQNFKARTIPAPNAKQTHFKHMADGVLSAKGYRKFGKKCEAKSRSQQQI